MTYKDISILKFQQIHNAIKISEGDEIRETYNVLSVMTGVSPEVYKAMKITDFQKECKVLSWMETAELPDKFVKEFEVKGEIFEIVQHATEWSTEQFVSMSNLTKDPNEIINNLHLIMATLTKGCDSIAEHDRRAKLLQENLSIEVAYPTGFFFAQFLAKLSETSQYSSHIKRKMNQVKQLQKKRTGFQKNGIGIIQ